MAIALPSQALWKTLTSKVSWVAVSVFLWDKKANLPIWQPSKRLKNAGIDSDFLQQNEVGILYGNDSVAESVILTNDKIREKKDTTLVGSGAVFRTMNSTVTMNLSTLFQLRGVNMSISAACASGSHSVGLGYLLIQSGMQDCVICGGAQEINKYSMGSF